MNGRLFTGAQVAVLYINQREEKGENRVLRTSEDSMLGTKHINNERVHGMDRAGITLLQ